MTVKGSVRARDDRISISCLGAELYNVPDPERPVVEQERAAVEADSGNDARVGVRDRRTGTGTVASAKHEITSGDGRDGHDSRGTQPIGTSLAGQRLLTLRLRETDKTTEDQRLLDDVWRLLVEHRGDDGVRLEIAIDGRLVTMDWPPLKVNVSPELEQGLQELLGAAGSVSVEGRQ